MTPLSTDLAEKKANKRPSVFTVIRNSHFFEYNGKYFFILKYSRQTFECSKEFYRLATGDHSQQLLIDEFDSDILLLEQSKYLALDTDVANKKSAGYKLAAMSLGLISDCNLGCDYCSVGPSGSYGTEKGHKMSNETAKNAIDYLVKNAAQTDLQIILFGGEPLLNWECVLFILDYTKKAHPQHRWHFYLITNGTLIDDSKAKTIKEYDMTVTVTLSGPPEIHDKSRHTRDGRGSWDKVYRGIQTLDKYDVNYIIKSVLPAEFVDKFDEVEKYMKDLPKKSSRLNVHPEHDYMTNNPQQLWERNNREMRAYLERLSATGKPEYFHDDDLQILLGEWGSDTGCDAGRGSLFVSSMGFIYNCHISGGQQDSRFVMGNVNSCVDESKRRKVKDWFEFEKEQCSTCWLNSLCSKGGCNHYKVSVLEYPDEYCSRSKSSWEMFIYHCSFFKWDHIEKHCSRYTKKEELEKLRLAYTLRETISARLKHIKPLHLLPAASGSGIKRAPYRIER